MHAFARRASILTGLFLAALADAQVNLTNAFPGLTFNRPVYIGQVPGLQAKTFVILEQHLGEATVVFQRNNAWVKQNMLKVGVNQSNEMGLLGIAFHPDYATNRKYYINYNPAGNNLATVIEEREADSTLIKDAGKARVILNVPNKHSNHNGGTLGFGPKDSHLGYLYIGMGDGGSQNDPDSNGQNKNALLGKMLRIDVNRKDAGLEYGIPADNPFAAGGGRGEVYAYGLRNPWKWSFDPVTGELWVGDVGQLAAEEVTIVEKGGNYGWNHMEGTLGTNSGDMILPVHSYGRSVGTCIIGGYVYRGDPASQYYGSYFFSDQSGRKIWALKRNAAGAPTVTEVASLSANPITFGMDNQGLMYVGTQSATSPIYLLDSPALGPATTGIRSQAPVVGRERTFTAMSGGRLPEGVFAGSGSVNVFTLQGALAATVSKASATLPAGIRSGLYFLKAPGAAKTAMLIVP